MHTLLLCLMACLCSVIACKSPRWFWTAYLLVPAFMELLVLYWPSLIAGGNAGTLLLRDSDPATLAALIGIAFQLKKRPQNIFAKRYLGFTVLLIITYICIKILCTVLFSTDAVYANRFSNHSLFGLVAAVGEARDSLLEWVIVVFAYIVPASRNLKTLRFPLVICSVGLLFRAALTIAHQHVLWTDDIDLRMMNAQEAMSVTWIGIVLFLVNMPTKPRTSLRIYCIASSLFVLIANHRSQWISFAAGLSVIILISMCIRPILAPPKTTALVASGSLLLVCLSLLTIRSLDSFDIAHQIEVRLYAVTDPHRDADAIWRETVWKSRIEDVGDNWPWGRAIGNRSEVLFNNHWLSLPDHNVYVTDYQIGGALFMCLIALFWVRAFYLGMSTLLTSKLLGDDREAAALLSLVAMCLAFGVAYGFPFLGPAFTCILAIDLKDRRKLRSSQQDRRYSDMGFLGTRTGPTPQN